MAMQFVKDTNLSIIKSSADFGEELSSLSSIQLKSSSSSPKVAEILDALKQIGPRYVQAIVEFAQLPSLSAKQKVLAEKILNMTSGIATLIDGAKGLNKLESAFKNQEPEAESGDKIKAPKDMYIGAIFNSIYAGFACHPSFKDYSHWSERIASDNARKNHEDSNTNLEEQSLPKRPRINKNSKKSDVA
jgi:hypothetical protein